MNDVRDRENAASYPASRAPHEVQAIGAGHRFGPRAIVGAVRRRALIVCSVVAAALALAALVTALRPARYTATAEVVVDTSGGAPARPAAPGEDRAALEARILASREMAASVAGALRLDGNFLADQDGVGARLLGIFGGGSQGPRTAAEQQRRIIDRLVRDLVVTRLADTYSLTIGFTAADPDRAAQIANEYAGQYSGGRLAGVEAAASPLDRPYARIISRAEPPLSPASPRLAPALLIGGLIGLIGGVAAALVAERRLAGITSGRDIEKRLGLPHLGSVPILKSVLPNAASPLDAMVTAPMSGFAEAFRGVMMAIRHIGGRGTQVIVVTSALPNEGKTTIAACLARSIALGGESVVLIDCDARRRDTSMTFGLAARRPGLVEVLRYEATLDEALVRDAESGAWILPLTGPEAEISDLLAGPAMVALIEDLKRRFKRVLIDTAPILAIASTRAIAAMADLVAIVVRWRATADHAVLSALRLLPNEHVRIGGIILSQIDIRRQVRIGHGDPTFYYRQYSKYYS